MKAFRIVLLCVLSILVILYLTFLFVLPNSVNLNQYSPQITNAIQKNTGYLVNIKGLKVKTAWNLSLGASISKIDLMYSTGEKFAQINDLNVKLSLLPLFLRQIKIDKIEADKILANIEINKQIMENEQRKKVSGDYSSDLFTKYISHEMPDLIVKKYRISVVDGGDRYSFKGNNLKISDFVLNEKVKILADGNLILNERKQIAYNVSIFSKVFPRNQTQSADITKILKDLYKYNINASIVVDVAVNNEKNNTDIDGIINVDGLSFVFGGKSFPQSNMHLILKGDKAKINASFNVDKASKAVVTGFFNTGRNKSVDLHVISDRINVEDILLIAKAMSKPLGLKHLQNITTTGVLKADFKIKSDLKKVNSSGYLKIKNASVKNSLYKVLLDSLNADIDFSQDVVRIKKAKANLNGQPITVSGNINKNAIANISIIAQNLQLKSLLFAAGQTKILKENDILSGIVNVSATVKDRLDKAVFNAYITVNNASLKNRKSNTQIKLARATVISGKTGGTAKILGLYVQAPNSLSASAPNLNFAFDKNELNIENTYLYLGNVKTNLSGKISGLNSTPVLNPLTISLPNQISAPIKGYAGSKMVMKGYVVLSGDTCAPKTQGLISVPLINIPSISTKAQNITVKLEKGIFFNCPSLRIANSVASVSAQINDDFSKGIVAKNVNFVSDFIDLNSIIPNLKSLAPSSGPSFTVQNGKSKISKFRVGGILSSNISSSISVKNNILYINNLMADAYFGKVAGSISYGFINRHLNLNLQGRGLSASPALVALTGRDDDIHGVLDFDSNIAMTGHSKNELLQSLDGKTKFIISNGKMGVLGKFEHLLYAQNIISNNIFRATLNLAAKALTAKNTGVYKQMKGNIAFSNGWANIDWIKTSGPSMSLYISGRCYLPTNMANLVILGRISDDVVRVLGPIGEFSMDKAISYIPRIGEVSAFFTNQFRTNPVYENISQIPNLDPKTHLPTKEFKVVIDGDLRKQTSVKSFKWLAKPRVVQSENVVQQTFEKKQDAAIPDFVKNLPDLKN